MTDFPVFDTTGICRTCGREYPTKCFTQPTAGNPARGFCPGCQGLDDAKMARLQQPPKAHGKSRADPEPARWQSRGEPD